MCTRTRWSGSRLTRTSHSGQTSAGRTSVAIRSQIWASWRSASSGSVVRRSSTS
ncbi:hypothetical protein GA0115253_101448, partial [Streptomyces sp. Termitarium-T10T-6]